MVWLGLLDGQAKRDETIEGHPSAPPDRRPQGPDVGGDAVERTILRLHLVADFATDYFQTAVGAAIVTGELGQELDPLIGLDLLCEGNGGGLAHIAT